MEENLSDVKYIERLKEQILYKDKIIQDMYDKINEIKNVFKTVMEKDDIIYRSKRELEMIFDATDDYIVILDMDYNIKRANKKFCNLVGREPKKVVGTKFNKWFGNDIKIKFEDVDIPKESFIETIFYSKIYQKKFLLKSRKLEKDFEPLVYIHITKDISEMEKLVEC